MRVAKVDSQSTVDSPEFTVGAVGSPEITPGAFVRAMDFRFRRLRRFRPSTVDCRLLWGAPC
jgi:hypothetical protein